MRRLLPAGAATAMKIYHNPRCSKSRQTLELLRARGIEPEVVEYLKTPPGETELAQLLEQLGIGARDLLRTKEPEYKALGLHDPAIDDAALIRAMVEHPKLIERPIVVQGKRAVLGRPPEKVLELL